MGFRTIRSRFASRRRAAEDGELRARVMMDELCPHGWRAQLTLFGASEELPKTAPDGRPARVALDWMELDQDGSRAAVVRRVWAASVADALEAMVADRRTDETLQQIEQGALADGADWPDA